MRALTYEWDLTHKRTVLEESLKQALWPWDPGKTTVYRTDSRFELVWSIKIELLPGLLFRYDLSSWPYPPRADEILYDIADKAFYFYRERPGLPIDDHIVLGEN